MAELGGASVSLSATINSEHDWVARDGRAWCFRFVQVFVDARPGQRFAFLVNEDDLIGEDDE